MSKSNVEDKRRTIRFNKKNEKDVKLLMRTGIYKTESEIIRRALYYGLSKMIDEECKKA